MTLKKLGRFEIIRQIGKGAMGQVFLAHDPKIDRHVAIKTIVLPPGTSEEEARETSERFAREAQAAGKLLHPNIVTIFDVGEEEGVSFIAMEYIEGETLEKHTRPDQLLAPARVLDLIGQAAAGLDYAHQNKIIHRDVKPANLMVLKDGVLKVTDFGLAKNPSANLTQAGVLLGTPSYMSPEQIQGRELDGRSDLFSLGVVVYELLTGVRPFDGDSISTIIYKVLYEDPRPPAAYNPALPPDVNVLLEKALAKDPESRYGSCAELAAALNKAFAFLPPETLSRPFPVIRKGGDRAPTMASPVRTTVRGPRGGRPGSGPRPTRKPRSDRAGDAGRQTMIAQHPAKIAAVVVIALAGLVVFPRWVNRQEWTPPEQRVTAARARGDLVVNQAGIGSPPQRGPSLTGGGQVMIEIETIPHGGRIFVDDIPLAEPRVILSLTDPQEHDIVARAGCRQAIAAMTAADLES
ncbi:MAG: serine/threonine-protein kinase, partial [Acidobacteria bacterium]|nr:serine/threonine-protein kinase [Acidobacteriota bacterium]